MRRESNSPARKVVLQRIAFNSGNYGTVTRSFIRSKRELRLSADCVAKWQALNKTTWQTQWLATLRAPTNDLCWLLDHNYASHSATKLVGKRHIL
jgi:Protein of unknown function (DUF434)